MRLGQENEGKCSKEMNLDWKSAGGGDGADGKLCIGCHIAHKKAQSNLKQKSSYLLAQTFL